MAKKTKKIVNLVIIFYIFTMLLFPFFINEKKEIKFSRQNNISYIDLNISSNIYNKSIIEEDKDLKLKSFLLSTVQEYAPNNNEFQNKVIVDTIIQESELYDNLEPLMLFSVSLSESGCRVNAKHSLSYVKGICGINSKTWTKELIQNKVIKVASDLNKPKYSIKAMAYILNKDMESRKDFRKAVHKYKGKVPETIYQVNATMKIYKNLKTKIKEFNV